MIRRILDYGANAFPLWVALGGVLALFHPGWFTWFKGPWIVWGLAIIMLGMGLTLSPADFSGLLHMPKAALAGVVGQFTIMPAAGWLIATLTHLDRPFAVGLILVACCPGGTASNIVTYLARANVALSVLMTACSTMAAVVMTPLLTKWLAGALVPVDAWGLFFSTLQVVILPVALGVGLKRLAPRLVDFVQPGMPLLAALTVALICASIIGQSADAIRKCAWLLLADVALLHIAGFGVGYFFARVLRLNPITARTISIEVGMQNSGLGVVLARRHFADPLTAVPCAISSVMHSVIGSALAGYWRWKSRNAIDSNTTSRQG